MIMMTAFLSASHPLVWRRWRLTLLLRSVTGKLVEMDFILKTWSFLFLLCMWSQTFLPIVFFILLPRWPPTFHLKFIFRFSSDWFCGMRSRHTSTSHPHPPFSHFPQVEDHGSRAAEDSGSAKECKEISREEERPGCWPEDCCQGCTGPHLPCVPGKCSVSTFQNMEVTSMSSVEGRSILSACSFISPPDLCME